MDKGGTMPPRLHKVLGQWRIRCGTGTARRRCALLHQAVPTIAIRESADEEFEPQSTFSTHFVIDRVGAREVLLWRLSVDRVPNSIDAGKRRVTGVSAGGVAPPGRSLPQTGSRGKVSLEFDPIAGTGRLTLPFTVCVDAGCILEIHAERAGWIATRLAAGIPVAGNLIVDDGPADRFDLPVEGFKSALSELIRLRRAERQVSGR
jgi:hypothetical protein